MPSSLYSPRDRPCLLSAEIVGAIGRSIASPLHKPRRTSHAFQNSNLESYQVCWEAFFPIVSLKQTLNPSLMGWMTHNSCLTPVYAYPQQGIGMKNLIKGEVFNSGQLALWFLRVSWEHAHAKGLRSTPNKCAFSFKMRAREQMTYPLPVPISRHLQWLHPSQNSVA